MQEFRKLEYYCKNCDYVEDADRREWCVYISETTFSSKDKTVIVHVRFFARHSIVPAVRPC